LGKEDSPHSSFSPLRFNIWIPSVEVCATVVQKHIWMLCMVFMRRWVMRDEGRQRCPVESTIQYLVQQVKRRVAWMLCCRIISRLSLLKRTFSWSRIIFKWMEIEGQRDPFSLITQQQGSG
jgi:hypothetical protein